MYKKKLSLIDTYRDYGHLIGSIHDFITFIRSGKVTLRFEAEADIVMHVPRSFLEESLTSQLSGSFIDYVERNLSGSNPDIDFKIGDFQPLSFFYYRVELENFFAIKKKNELKNSQDICTFIKFRGNNHSSYEVWVPEDKIYQPYHFNSIEKGYLLQVLIDFFHKEKLGVISLENAKEEAIKLFKIEFANIERKTISEIFEKPKLSRYFSQKSGQLTFVHPNDFKLKIEK